jgi:hypothetical protein
MTDIESDGPCPGLYSMVSFGCVIVEPGLSRTFYGQCRPISDDWIPEALAVSGHSREECMGFDRPEEVMVKFKKWIESNAGMRKRRGRQVVDAQFISDNNGFDWQFINYYFHKYCKENPFGFSSQNQGSLYKGMEKTMFKSFKHLRKTKHTHHPVDDAKGNAEALLSMKEMGLQINL